MSPSIDLIPVLSWKLHLYDRISKLPCYSVVVYVQLTHIPYIPSLYTVQYAQKTADIATLTGLNSPESVEFLCPNTEQNVILKSSINETITC